MTLKIRHHRYANELQDALLKRGMTWPRDQATKASWAADFEMLEQQVGRDRLERVLNWYCQDGCGAVFVPIVASGETFRTKFDALDAARKRLRGKPLTYFDECLQYKIRHRKTGSTIQKAHAVVMQRLQQQVDFVDDLINGRAELPKPKATVRKVKQRNYSPYLTKARKRMTAKQKAQLDQLLDVDRELMWRLLMQNPVNQQALHDRLTESGFWQPFRKLERRAMKDLTKFDADLEEARRRHMLKPEFGRNPRKREAEYKLGKKAYCKGDAEKANPYRAGSLSAELWLEGWHAADIKKAKRA